MQSDDGSWPWQDLILSLSFCKIEYNSSLSRLNSNKRKKKKKNPILEFVNSQLFQVTYIYTSLSSTTTNQTLEAAAGSHSNTSDLLYAEILCHISHPPKFIF